MKKRLLILGMIFTMAVSSAGCGSSSSSDNAGRTDKQQQFMTVRRIHQVTVSPIMIRKIRSINQQMKSQWTI